MIARLYSNESFPLPVVATRRVFGHDVLTSPVSSFSGATRDDARFSIRR
jgi:hypothetical protein